MTAAVQPPTPELGELLNTANASLPCPKCGRQGPLQIYAKAARWACGHTRELPPLGPAPRRPYRGKKAERR